MSPTQTDERLINARAVARNLRDAAQLCMCDQAAVRARLIQAAQTIDEVATMAEASTFVAKLNHETIVGMHR
jgi:capsule polysaccharide export protein KpsC/LpsZ